MTMMAMTGWQEGRAVGVRGPLLDRDEEVIAIGDIHGRGRALDALMDRLGAMQKRGRRTVVFTGDVIDRGADNLRAVEAVMGAGERLQADATHVGVGNHELMMLDVLKDPQRWEPWFLNGGSSVLEELGRRDIEVRTHTDIPEAIRATFPAAWLAAIETAPSHVRIGRLLFVHAGVDPADMEACLRLGSEDHWPAGANADRSHWAWVREPFLEHEGGFGGVVVVHGHTPVFGRYDRIEHADIVKSRMDRMRDRARVNIDAGAATNERIGFLHVAGDQYRIGVVEL